MKYYLTSIMVLLNFIGLKAFGDTCESEKNSSTVVKFKIYDYKENKYLNLSTDQKAVGLDILSKVKLNENQIIVISGAGIYSEPRNISTSSRNSNKP